MCWWKWPRYLVLHQLIYFFLDFRVAFIPGVTQKIGTRNFKQVLSYELKGSLYLTSWFKIQFLLIREEFIKLNYWLANWIQITLSPDSSSTYHWFSKINLRLPSHTSLEDDGVISNEFFTSKNTHYIYLLPSKACDVPLMHPEHLRLAASRQNCRCHFLSGTEIIRAEPTDSPTVVISVLSAPFSQYVTSSASWKADIRYWLSNVGHAFIMQSWWRKIYMMALLLLSFSIHVSWELPDISLNFLQHLNLLHLRLLSLYSYAS